MGSLLEDLNLKRNATGRHKWVSTRELEEYRHAVILECGCNQIKEDVDLDYMSNEDYKKGILECYRRALEKVPMPSETPP